MEANTAWLHPTRLDCSRRMPLAPRWPLTRSTDSCVTWSGGRNWVEPVAPPCKTSDLRLRFRADPAPCLTNRARSNRLANGKFGRFTFYGCVVVSAIRGGVTVRDNVPREDSPGNGDEHP